MQRQSDITTEAKNIGLGLNPSSVEIKAVWCAEGEDLGLGAEGVGVFTLTISTEQGVDAELSYALPVTTWSPFLRAVAVECLKIEQSGVESEDWFDNAWKVM